MAYTPDSVWRNRDQFLQGRDAIEAFLTKKWGKENGYRLRKELFAFKDNKVRCPSLSCSLRVFLSKFDAQFNLDGHLEGCQALILVADRCPVLV